MIYIFIFVKENCTSEVCLNLLLSSLLSAEYIFFFLNNIILLDIEEQIWL